MPREAQKPFPPLHTPLAYVIVLNWNGKDLTTECLASLRRITYPNSRVLVVDNASTDGSIDMIHQSFPEVEVLPLQSNRRFAGGNNAGIIRALEAGAECIVLLNNDTTVDPDFLTRLVEAYQSEPGAGMIAPKILYADVADTLWYAGGKISLWTATAHHVGIREVDRGQHDIRCDTGYATGCCVLTSRPVVQRIGMLDESYYMYGEDADWCLRARSAGYRILYEPQARIWHKLSVSAGGHLSFFKLRNRAVSSLRLVARHASWYHWLVFPWLMPAATLWSLMRYLFTRRRQRWN